MFTRQQYLLKECTYDQYYAQFVRPDIIQTVLRFIGEARIKKSTCPHFNDIPLSVWDDVALYHVAVGNHLRKCGDVCTLAGKVCILKAAANQIRFCRDTPETEAEAVYLGAEEPDLVVPAEFARRLERERNEARAELARVRKEVIALQHAKAAIGLH